MHNEYGGAVGEPITLIAVNVNSTQQLDDLSQSALQLGIYIDLCMLCYPKHSLKLSTIPKDLVQLLAHGIRLL